MRRRAPTDRLAAHLNIDRVTAENPGKLDFNRLTEMADANGSAGAIVLTFEELERDDQEIVSDPVVRKFIRHMFGEVPYILYYLDPLMEGITLFIACAYARDDQIIEDGQRISIAMDARLASALARRLAAAGLFAASRGDEWEDVILEYRFPKSIADQAIAEVRLRLVSQ